jgi:TRAP-type C4-dicarboxylate transport system substrate-binding protein
MPPLVAEAGQIDKTASNMLELNWAPLVGAIVLDKATWDSFPKPQQAVMRQAAAQAATEIRQKGRSESDRAVTAMQRRGLKLQKTTPEIEAEWQKTAEEVYPKIRGTIVPADMFDRVKSLVQEYRSSKR